MLEKIKNSKGMTIIEILISLGILVGASAGLYFGVIKGGEKAKIRQAQGEIEKISNFIKIYKQDKGDYPATGQGLAALVEEGYVDEALQDPWKHDYIYELPSTHGMKFDLCSDGPDADTDADDICNWTGKDEE